MNSTECQKLRSEMELMRKDLSALKRQIVRVNIKVVENEKTYLGDTDRLRHRTIGHVKYEIIEGQRGDYHTPTIHPEVSVVDIEIKPEQDFDPDVIRFLEEEIEDELSEEET